MKISTLEDDVESTCLQSSLKRNKTHQTESEESKISFNNLLSNNNDGLVLSNIFTYCSPDDIPSLSLVSREWYDMFFSKGTIWKEWFDEWWKRTFSGSLREWTCLNSYEEEYELDFKVRLVKLLNFERKVRLGIITDDDAANIQDYEAKQAEEEEDDDDVGQI